MSVMSQTKIFTVHINPSLSYASEKPEFVREVFNIYAFIFGTLWALYNRLWIEAFMIFMVIATLAIADQRNWLDAQYIMVLNIAFSTIIGFQANDLKRGALARRGYVMSDVVVGDNELRAQQRYFDRMLAA
jgi:hypothetical protein